MSQKHYELPVLNSLELIKKTENGIVNIWIGITDPDQIIEALQKIGNEIKCLPKHRSQYYFDFQNDTKIGSRSWSIDSGFMVYENTDTVPTNELVVADSIQSDTGFERIYWYSGKLL